MSVCVCVCVCTCVYTHTQYHGLRVVEDVKGLIVKLYERSLVVSCAFGFHQRRGFTRCVMVAVAAF